MILLKIGSFVMKKIELKLLITFKIAVISLMVSLICPVSIFGYDPVVHEQISFNAIKKSSLNSILNQIGFSGGIDQKIIGCKEKSIKDWVQYGSSWEDNITWKNSFRFSMFGERGVMYCHFYNPLYDIGYYNLDDNENRVEKGESLIHRMNDYVGTGVNGWFHHNEWSYQMARDLYYAALTGDSTQHEYWYMLDEITYFYQYKFEGKENMNHEEREQFFAWTFQALGHTLHLIQDSSVPAHTRNDSHMYIPYTRGILQDTEPFENWTVDNIADLKYNDLGSAPWTKWKNYSGIPAQNTFIDTYPHPEGSTDPDPISQSDGFDQGLAQYSYANFLSKGSIYPDNPLGHGNLHDLDGLGLNHLGDVILKEDIQIGDTERSFFYVKNGTTGIDHFALCGLTWSIKQMVASQGHAAVTGILYSVNDPLVSEDYAKKLIPRAVGYSAGFLDYFFRGKIDMIPDEQNSCSYVIENGTDEEMVGTFELYYDNTDDERVQIESGDFPLETTIAGNDISSSVSFKPPDDAKEPGKYILVFRGKLGNEEDAVAGYVYSTGTIEIAPPNRYVYAILDMSDGSMPGQFTEIKVKLKNIAPNDEAMVGGKLTAIARYYKPIDSSFDPTQQVPYPEYMEEEYSCSISAENASPPPGRDDFIEYTFDFTANPIPTNVTDLILQIVYRGKLGEEENAVAVGMIDIFEPDHIDIWNSTDYFCNDGTLIRSNLENDLDGDHIADRYCSPTPVNTVRVTFSMVKCLIHYKERSIKDLTPLII